LTGGGGDGHVVLVDHRSQRSATALNPSCWAATLTAMVSLASGCGGLTGATTSDGATSADAGETSAAVPLDASEAADAPDGSLPDGGLDAAGCPSDVIFMAVEDEVSGTGTLETFAPATGRVTQLGPITCANSASPVTGLAVDRTGAIYMNVADLQIRRLDTTTFECEPGLPVPAQGPPGPWGYQPNGIALVGEGTRDVLYESFAQVLDTVDVDSGALQAAPDGTGMQLAGTGDGRLFVVQDTSPYEVQAVLEFEPTTGDVVQSYSVPVAPGSLTSQFLPIAVWGGDIYVFAYDIAADAGGDAFVINRFHPSDGTVVTVARVEGSIGGASAATCPPNP
jgi:hypothetical protein